MISEQQGFRPVSKRRLFSLAVGIRVAYDDTE